MISKKWLAAGIAAASLTTVAGTTAFATQNGGRGGDGGQGGNAGSVDNLKFTTGDVTSDNKGVCTVGGTQGKGNNGKNSVEKVKPKPKNGGGDFNGSIATSCRGFNTGGTGGRVSIRTGNGGRGGAGGWGGSGGDRLTRSSAASSFPF